MDPVDHPNLFKENWKTPYRDSSYNVQKKLKIYDQENMPESYGSIPQFDLNNPDEKEYLQNYLTPYTGNEEVPIVELNNKSEEEKRADLWN